MVSEDFFTEHNFSWGSRTSAPSWRPRGHGLHYAIFLLFGSLMLFQLNYMAWIFEYVATYATACSLLQPCEPLCRSWLCRPAALGEKEASCAIRQAPAVHSSSGELLLLSHSFVWNGICVSHLVYSDFLSRPDGGICSFVDSQFLDEFGEEATTLLPLQLGPVPSPGVINLLDILQDTVMTGVRVPPGPPTGGEPNSDSTSWPSHGGKMAGGATQHRTTARDCNMMPCPTHVLSVWCAIFRPPASTEILQKVAGNYKYYFGNRSLWQPPFGPACCAGRQQTAFSAGVIAPLVYPGFFVETMSAICTLSKSVLENGHAPPRHAGLRGPPSVLVICAPISRLRVFQFQFWDSMLQFFHVLTHATGGTTRRSHCKGTGVSGAAGRPCLLQAFACWEPAAGPHSCTWDVRGSAHSASGVTSRPLTFGSQAALLLLALSCRSCCIDTGVSGAAGRPYLLQSFTRVVLSTAPQEPATGLLLSGAARRPCYCRHFKFGAVVLALVSREPQAGPVCCRPLRKKAVLPTVLQEQAIGHSFSGDARRPCCCSPLEPGTVAWCWSLGSCRSALFAAGLFVLGAVRRPIQLHLGRLLLAVLKEPSTGPLLSGAVRRPCCCALPPSFGCRLSALLTVLKALSTGPLLLGAVRRPCCCRPFCFGCRLPAHSTVLGDVCQQDNVPMCLLVVAFTPKACASVESQTRPLLA